MRFSRAADGSTRMHYKIHFASKHWMPRGHDGILILRSMPKGVPAYLPWVIKQAAFMAKLRRTIEMIEELGRRYNSVPVATIPEWRDHEQRISRGYSEPTLIAFSFTQSGVKDRIKRLKGAPLKHNPKHNSLYF